jgi:hypothetical protein
MRSPGNQEVSPDNQVSEPGDFGDHLTTPTFPPAGPRRALRTQSRQNEAALFRVPPDEQ